MARIEATATHSLLPSDQKTAWLRLGAMLQTLRAERGLRSVDLANLANLSQSTISKIETGKYPTLRDTDFDRLLRCLNPSQEQVRQLRSQYSATQLPKESYRFINQLGVASKQLEILAFESAASLIRGFEPILIPGLLQTPEYIRAVLRELGVPTQHIEPAVQARLKRQELISAPDKHFIFVIGEAALYSMSCGSHERIAQINRLAWITTGPTNVALGILPMKRGYPAAAANSFTIMDDIYVTAETVIAEQQVHDPFEISQYSALFESLQERAVFNTTACKILSEALTNTPEL